jgi:hypothetical protein
MKKIVLGRKKQRRADKAPTVWRDAAATRAYDYVDRKRYKDSQLGTMGPASEVRHIDPAEYVKVLTDSPIPKTDKNL